MVQIHIWYHQSSMNDLWKEILISLYSWLSLEESLSSNQVLGVNLNGIVTMIILMQNGLQKLWSGKHSRILAILSWIFPGRRPSVPRRLAAALQIFLDHLAVTCDIENDREMTSDLLHQVCSKSTKPKQSCRRLEIIHQVLFNSFIIV